MIGRLSGHGFAARRLDATKLAELVCKREISLVKVAWVHLDRKSVESVCVASKQRGGSDSRPGTKVVARRLQGFMIGSGKRLSSLQFVTYQVTDSS